MQKWIRTLEFFLQISLVWPLSSRITQHNCGLCAKLEILPAA